jgi:hypothetical protein
MQQILAWVTRFAVNARKPKEQREFWNLKPAELRAGLNGAVRWLQSTFFAAETRSQQANHAVKSTSRVQNLNVSTNDQRILRVGGRIKKYVLFLCLWIKTINC